MSRELRVVEMQTGKTVRVVAIQDGASESHVQKVEMGLLRRIDLDRFYVVDSKDEDTPQVTPPPKSSPRRDTSRSVVTLQIAKQRDDARRVLRHIVALASRVCRELTDCDGDARDAALRKIKALALAGSGPIQQPAAESLSEEARKAVLTGEVDLDGYVDLRGVEYIGKAARQPDGTWRCLAKVGDALCIVEAKITFPPPGAP